MFKDKKYSSPSEKYPPEDQGSRKKPTGTPRGRATREPAEDKEVDVGEHRNDRQESGEEDGRTGSRGVGTKSRTVVKETTTPRNQRNNTTGTLHGRATREPAENEEIEVGERRNDRTRGEKGKRRNSYDDE